MTHASRVFFTTNEMNKTEAAQLVAEITAACQGRDRIALMEVCGTHTVGLFRSGIKSLLPAGLHLISGPGCPVCVTSQGYLDTACELAARDEVTICTYGDMVRVPGSTGSLEQMRSRGAKVVVVYSARDALRYAIDSPARKAVLLAVGFETTTPATAMTVLEAEARGVENLFILPGHKLVIPAMDALLTGGEVPIDGFLCPGHVSVIIGADAYRPIVDGFGKPCVVAGFEPRQMLEGVLHLVLDQGADSVRRGSLGKRGAGRDDGREEGAHESGSSEGTHGCQGKVRGDAILEVIASCRS